MGKFRNTTTGVVVSVDDSKDHRFASGWEPYAGEDSASEGDSTDDGAYKGMKVDALKAEIAKRNEGRDEADLLSDEGLKADLVATLEADDNK